MEARSRRTLSRRRLLQFSALGGLGLLGGCGQRPAVRLIHSRGDLPAAWLKRLPAPWRAEAVDGPAAVLGARDGSLLQLPDGWLGELGPEQLQPFAGAGDPAAEALFAGLAPFARSVSHLFGSDTDPPLAYPWAFGTWLLLLRNHHDLAKRTDEGWNLLLDPSLQTKLVLPSSPRVVIDLVLRQLGLDGDDPLALEDPRLEPRLARLRRQTLAFDERDGLNLLLTGRAEAAVLPSQRVLPLLRSDSRLTAVLPAGGSPLWWNLLLRPAGTRQSPPLDWLRQASEPPLIDRLLAAGWVPPLPRQRLATVLASWPQPMATLLYPPPQVLELCSSLAPLGAAERTRLQRLWDRTTTGPQSAS